MNFVFGYYIDENENKWNCLFFTKEEAEEYSKTMEDCKMCKNCTHCKECRNCTDCNECRNCIGCTECYDCINCNDCTECIDCRSCNNCLNCKYCGNCEDCTDCGNCLNCIDCRNCKACRSCADCKNYGKNPRRYTGKVIGSRGGQTTTYWLEDNIQVVCGCFRGNLEEFEDKVIKTHTGTDHEKNYMEYIKIIKTIIEMENRNGD